MTIEVRKFENLPKLFTELETLALANEEIVFRGHQDAKWTIASTLARYTTIPHRPWDSSLDEMLSHFIANALLIDKLPFPLHDRRARLEYGRHHGVPTPVVDYTHSPYVALYFAFSGMQYHHGSPATDAAVYALNLGHLATGWVRLTEQTAKFDDAYSDFLREHGSYFEYGYPGPDLKYVPFCASWNTRMRAQQGSFIYDTLDYATIGHDGFEGMVSSFAEPTSPDGHRHPTLIKFLIPHSEAGNVFSRLELMNISGTRLLDREGLATDVRNAYNYSRKTGYVWDLEMTPPDDTKM